jgi:hypothetical protein
MDSFNIALTKYELDALITCIEKYSESLDRQKKDISSLKYSSSNDRKDLKREIEKRSELLASVQKRLKENQI